MTLKEKVEKELPGMIVPETGLPLSCPGYYRTVRLNDDHTLKNCKQILEDDESCTCEKCWNREYRGCENGNSV